MSVLVKWIDISSFDGPWMTKAEAKELKPIHMETLGWIIHETEEYIIVVSTLDNENDSVGNVNCLPRTLITDIKTIEL